MNVRETAFICLKEIIVNKQFANIVLQKDYGLNQKDTALLTQIVYGTLRNYRILRESWIGYVNKKPVQDICILLDSASYQLLFLDKLPVYAIINESVEIAKGINRGAYFKLVNAVLRKVSENGLIKNDSLAVRTSHPDWLVNLWKAHYGEEICEKICEDDQKQGRVSLRVNTLKTTEEELLKDPKFEKGEIDNCVYYADNIIRSEYFEKALVLIQNESSQLPVNVLKPHGNVLDMCAAPGSKTVQMAMEMNNTGHIVSVDLYPHRVKLIEHNLQKYGITNTKTLAYDATKLAEKYPEESFDCILLDAPCSGLGVLKHKPDIKLNITPESIDEITALQKQLLETAAVLLKKGGEIVYSTCTLDKKENERQISAFLSLHPEFELLQQRTVFPYELDSDGFFYANMRKV
ncbi:MAG: 16S rRNA (cytosine(967)-C(5))-methyltransferase RsmB [Erysipelotrichaceae bacterium]|nr:16S rRNA (cytosine(967)-C(5))-methyltransferase RsmB [Erysipelotrichaceae bacterium]